MNQAAYEAGYYEEQDALSATLQQGCWFCRDAKGDCQGAGQAWLDANRPGLIHRDRQLVNVAEEARMARWVALPAEVRAHNEAVDAKRACEQKSGIIWWALVFIVLMAAAATKNLW